MRKMLPFAIILLLVGLSGCRLNATQSNPNLSPTLSDVQLQTQISTLLTVKPTATAAPIVEVSPTPALPTPEALIPATVTPGEVVPTATATQVPAAANPTATPPPTLTPGNPTPTPPPTLTPTSGPTATVSKDDPRPRQGNPTSTDPMDNSTHWIWPTGLNDFTAIDFASGAMNLTSLKTTTGWRLANPTGEAFSNLYLEAIIKTGTCATNDQYGMIVRVPVIKDADQGYLFGFTCDGHYSLRLWDGTVGTKGQMTRLVDWTASKAIYAGSNQINRIGLMMIGGRMLMYANGTLLGEVTNNTYSSGYFGLYVGGAQTPNFTIQVDEMSYWDNPKP